MVAKHGQLKWPGNPPDEKQSCYPQSIKKLQNKNENRFRKSGKKEGGNSRKRWGVLNKRRKSIANQPQVEAQTILKTVQHETSVSILYLLKYSGDVENAREIQNWSSARFIFGNYDRNNLVKENFHVIQIYGIANVNIGTSG